MQNSTQCNQTLVPKTLSPSPVVFSTELPAHACLCALQDRVLQSPQSRISHTTSYFVSSVTKFARDCRPRSVGPITSVVFDPSCHIHSSGWRTDSSVGCLAGGLASWFVDGVGRQGYYYPDLAWEQICRRKWPHRPRALRNEQDARMDRFRHHPSIITCVTMRVNSVGSQPDSSSATLPSIFFSFFCRHAVSIFHLLSTLWKAGPKTLTVHPSLASLPVPSRRRTNFQIFLEHCPSTFLTSLAFHGHQSPQTLLLVIILFDIAEVNM